MRAAANDLTNRLGVVVAVSAVGDGYAVAFEHGSIAASLQLDAAGKIAGLLFHDEQSPRDEAALTKLLTEPKLDTSLFSPTVRGLVNIDQIAAVRAQVASGGKFVRVVATQAGYIARFERTESHASITTDADGLITSIRFKPPTKRSP